RILRLAPLDAASARPSKMINSWLVPSLWEAWVSRCLGVFKSQTRKVWGEPMHVSRARQQRVPLWHIAPRLLSVSICLALALIALAMFRAPPSRADAFEGLQSYEQGRKDEAIRLLRRAAWQDNSIFAQFKLAEIYSAKSESDKGYKDLVESAVWY